METVCGRGGGMRSGRAVVGLDVISHTLPRNFRTPAHPPCCQPAPRPQCAGCRPDLCVGEDTTAAPQCHQAFPTYPAHFYPTVLRGGWGGGEGGPDDCATCRLQESLPCPCRDPRCLGVTASPLACTWDSKSLSRDGRPPSHASYQDLQMTRTASMCALPKLMSVEERLSTALGHPLAPPHKHTNNTHANTHANTNANTQANTHTTPQAYSRAKTQAHVHTASQTHKHNHNTTTNTAGDDGSSAHAHAHAHGQGLGASRGSRLSRSVESLPRDIKEHILKCQCSCDHLGYGNFSATSLHHLPGMSNGCSSLSSKTNNSHEDLPSQEVTELRHKHKGGGVEVPAHVWGGVCLVLVLAGVAGVGVSVPLALKADPNAGHHKRLDQATTLLRETPLVDGHNDLPWNIRKFMHNKLHSFNFTAELKKLRPWSRSSWSHTDLPRLKEGRVGAQFWVSYVPCESQRLNAVQLTIEQIDLIKRLIDQYPDDLRLATSADEVEAAFKEGRIASLIGVEGGHAIQNSLGVLRALRDLGVRYLTLTHTCSTPWAECARAQETDAEDPNSPRGLTHFGKTVVREMNRLGLLVDLSHVSQATMKEALEVSRAPVIFSHSSVYAICKNPRNVPDDILRKVASNGGVVMVSFYNYFLTCSKEATISDVIEHINHVRKVAGIDHVGIGADFDGINMLPEGLGDVSGYPRLFAELLADPNWTLQDLKKLAGHNLLRVMREAEKVRLELKEQKIRPYEEEAPRAPGDDTCFYRFTRHPDHAE